jgi:hypothetical protein
MIAFIFPSLPPPPFIFLSLFIPKVPLETGAPPPQLFYASYARVHLHLI